MTNRQIALASRPDGAPGADNFEMRRVGVPAVGDGQVLRQTIYLSLDPYMRGRMSDAPSYSAHVEIGQTMVGHTVSQVIEWMTPRLRPAISSPVTTAGRTTACRPAGNCASWIHRARRCAQR